MKNLLTSLKPHLLKYFNVGGQFKKRQRYIQQKKKMGKFNDFGVIAVIFGSLLLFFTRLYHRPLRKIKYYRHKIITKNVISDKVIEIELIKNDKSDINRQIRIDVIEFSFHGFDKNYKEFVDNLLIDRIDDNDLVFEKNNDIGLYKVRIPFEFSLKYFDTKEIKLTVSYKTPLNDDFIIHDRLIDLTEITNKFKILLDRQIALINYQSPLTTEERVKLFNEILPLRDGYEKFELNNNQFTLNNNANWINNEGETLEEYDKRKADGE